MPMLDLGPAAREVTRLLDGVTDDQLSDPTTCPGTPVAGMLDHMMGFSLAFLWAARKEIPEGGGGAPQADAANLDPEWRTVLPQRVSELAEAWRDPAAWEGMTEAGGVTMPGEAIGMVALDELVMHGWDLARATGQSFTCDPVSASAVLAFTAHMAEPGMAAAREGLFGPVVDIPEDAPDFDRALGNAGRDPGWTPSSA
ncbi:MAG: TIGR03086 family metal-binding protein [Actinomycetota bacterium]|nr:TIGR03086 family metal-binding protein [Actinomycetota bacterium]